MNETEDIQSDDIRPLYQKLFNYYSEAILSQEFSPGIRIDSITEIMKKHGVSRETAKLVLKKLSDEGLIIQKAGKGSFVAPLGPKRPVWGIVIPFMSDHHEKLIGRIGMEAEAAGRTIEHFVDHNQWEEEIRLVGRLIRERYEAVIVAPTLDESRTAEFYRQLKSGGTLVALVDHTMAGSYFTYAIQSYDLGVKRAVRYLQSRTSGNLAFIKSDIWAGRNMIQEVMEQTFINFVQEIPGEQRALVLDRVTRLDADLIRREGIGGFFCCDDTDAVRTIGRLVEWGFKVPGDLSVISYGNTDLARYFTPRITSIDPHAEEMARRIAELIRMHGEGKSVRFEQYVIQPDLVIRET
jgi:DNA-binding LacI/PurR family transcriptional regulator